ncbi:somatostatin receptor type 1-like [Mercenaria mercenaria]|uniref:somatostatin receptor type 1-like n=1 Tax=Mercenaria mercenaria TaxID=6596 RepID=UPI00234F81C2|nr:somatostatin receptor type 1-like [Mercenaria mercenaria]
MNNITDLYLESDVPDRKNKFKITLFVVLAIVALATYFGNILILVSLRKFTKYLKGTPYILLGNLAVADLLLAFALTLELIGSVLTSLQMNRYYCVVKIMITAVSLATSGKLLLFISVDRFCAIMFPMKHLARSRKTKTRRVKLALTWSISVLVGVIPIAVNASSSKVINCYKVGELIPEVLSLLASTIILLQFVINVVLCLIVMWRLRTNTMSRQKYKSSMIKCGFLIKVYVVFVICWFPFVLNTFLVTMSDEKQRYMSFRKYTIIPGIMNSAMNWIIYSLANKKMRNAFKHVLLCRNERELRATSYIQAMYSETMTSRTDRERQLVQSSDACETVT